VVRVPGSGCYAGAIFCFDCLNRSSYTYQCQRCTLLIGTEVSATSPDGEQFYTVTQVGRMLGVSDQSVRRWIKAGELKAYKPKKEYRIAESDLREFLEERQAGPLAQAPLPDFDLQRRSPTPEELNAIRVVEDDCSKLEELLDRVDLTAEYNEPLVRLLDNHVKVVAATTLPLIKQEALRPLLLPGVARLVELAGRIRMAEETRNIINEVEQAAHNAS
jgi:excisionase family DNA binding protein